MQRNFPGVSDDVKGSDDEEINSKKNFVKRKVKRYFSYEENGDNQSYKTVDDNKSSINKGLRRDKRTSKTNDLKEIVTIAKLKQWRFKGRENDGVKTTAPIPKEKVMRYSRGESVDIKGVRGKIHKRQLESKEQLIGFSNEQAARSELLLTEETGAALRKMTEFVIETLATEMFPEITWLETRESFLHWVVFLNRYLIADEGEDTAEISQAEIAECVDITSAAKKFELQLREFGPYRMNYSRNGRFLLLGGYKGHLAAMDWVTKKLLCEINVMESIHDVRWLHTEAMYAVAQKSWTYIYDSQGIELHCLKQLHRVTRLDFLPYHFLLTACSDNGYLTWLDVSIGKIVANFYTRQGHLNIMAQNPQNALMCLGHAKGTVSMWSPNSKDPLVTMLCHKAPLTSLAVHPTGNYLATAASDRSLNIWDLRNFGAVQRYRLNYPPSDIAFSQKGLLAAGNGNVVEIFQDCATKTAEKPYIRHNPRGAMSQLQFCPFEDVLGVSTRVGFESLLIPGSGEANFDAMECNPYQTKKQRQEAEVKALLEKIQPELITLNPFALVEVDVPTLKEKVEAKMKLKYVRPPKVVWDKKRKGKGGPASKTSRKLQEQSDKAFREKVKELQSQLSSDEEEQKQEEKKETAIPHVLDRFKPKKKKPS